jgi:hypothetical protein
MERDVVVEDADKRKVFIIGLGLFTVASVAVGAAETEAHERPCCDPSDILSCDGRFPAGRSRPSGRRSPAATIWELNACCMSRSADRLRSSDSGPPTRERRCPRHQESTMPKYLPHDEYTPQELAGGRS